MRRFSNKQRQAVELVQGRTGEADHITPYSRGGETKVENCQMLSPNANKKKAAFQFVPRGWQSEFLKEWRERSPHQPFMLIAIPGGGKTMAALEACRRWMAVGSDRRIIVVVPTDNLREQWKDEAHKFGISLQTKEFGTSFKDDFQGGVVTYHLVANSPLVFRKLCSVAPTMVVFDEIHHCGEDAHFGNGITEAFDLAKEKLLLSGTPWKSDGRPIPYVRYDGNGFAVGNFSYDYPRALTENVVRYLVFDHAKGSIKNDCTGEIETLSQEITDDEAACRLKKILDADGDYLRSMVQEAHKQLMICRQTVPDAAAMAACIDQAHAGKVAKLIREVTRCEPSVIVSDADVENDNVRQFRNKTSEWLVSVRKVSEGTDIKRLQVLCYFTNTTTELFFRQLIGRVSRVRDLEDFEAYVYLPADPRLIRCAQNIENAQVQALREQVEKDARELKERQQRELQFDSYSTSHDGTDVFLIGSERVSADEANEIRRVSEKVGLSMQKVMQVMQETQSRPKRQEPGSRVEQTKEDRMDDLRKKCSKYANKVARKMGVDIRNVHKEFKQQSRMTERELESKLEYLLKALGKS